MGYHCEDLWVNLLPCVGGWLIQGFAPLRRPDSIDAPPKLYWTRDGKWVEQLYEGPREAPDQASWAFEELETQLPLAVTAAKE